MPELISSHTNPLIKHIRSLRQKKGREDTRLFLVEGILHIGEAIEAQWNLEILVYAPDLLKSDFALSLVKEQRDKGVRCAELSSGVFVDITGKDNPQGLLAIFHQRYLTLGEISDHFSFGAAIVSPQDPGNVGTILRTLDAVGADGLFLLDGGVELYHPSLVRASMGALFWKPVIQTSFDEFEVWSRKNGCRLVGTSAHGGIDYRDFKRENKPTILLLGNEQKGLPSVITAACDVIVSLPMKGRASSLNLSVAAGILLYQVMNK